MNKNFSSFFKNKRVLSLALGATLLLSFLPTFSAKAGLLDDCPPFDIFCAIGTLFAYVITLPVSFILLWLILPLVVVVLVSSLIFSVALAVFNWITGVVLSVYVIPYRGNLVLDAGWEFTRDFANMFFILALVFIGLSTILRIKEYEAQKALPKLIRIALLINFTPVIVGFIVDMANIVTAFFLSQATNFSAVDKMGVDFVEGVVKDALAFEGGDDVFVLLGDFAMNIVQGIITILYYFYATYVFCLAISLFFFRIISLWILMILSPIAFMSYIFPEGAQIVFPSILGWKEWWKELLQWSIVGIPFGFFLYLSSMVMGTSPASLGFTSLPSDGMAQILGTVLSPILGLALLQRGYEISKKAAPEGARAIIEKVEGAGKTAVTAAAAVATGGASLAMGGAVGAVGKVAARIPGARGLTKYTEAYKDKQTKNWHERFDKVPEGFKDMESSKGQLRIMNTEMKRGRSGRAVGMWNSLSKERQKLLLEKDKEEEGNLGGSLATASHEIGEEDRYREAANKIDKKFSKENTYDSQLNLQIDKEAFADNIKKLKKELEEELGDEKLKVLVDTEKGKDFDEKLQNFATKVGYYKKAKTSDIDDWDKDTFKDNKALSYAMRDKGPQFAIKVHETAAPDNWEELYNGKHGVGKMTAKDLKKRNSYFYHSFGRNKVLQAIGQKDIQENVGWDNVDLMGEQYEVEEMSAEDIEDGIKKDRKLISDGMVSGKRKNKMEDRIKVKEKLLEIKIEEQGKDEVKKAEKFGISNDAVEARTKKIAEEITTPLALSNKTYEISQREPGLSPGKTREKAKEELLGDLREAKKKARKQLIKEREDLF